VGKFKENIGLLSVIFIGLIVFLITLPFIILSLPFTYYNRKKFEKQYSDFLELNNDVNFFCYNNRKNSKEFIENEIIPNLKNNIEIVYLNGKKIETKNYPKDFISNALYNLKNYSKFPHLMKIRDGKLIDKSINTLFYSIKNQNKSKEKLLAEVNDFFELN
jgi:hypothetical protein